VNGSVIGALRPKQWLKNVLVFAAPAAAGVLDEPEMLRTVTLAFAAFCLAASSLYVLNDLVDRERDQSHPDKRSRPVASGRLSTRLALVVASTAAVAAAAIAVGTINAAFSWLLAGYAVNTITYTLWGKHQPVVDLLQVSLGFVLRAVGGALAADVRISVWFAVVAMFGSLLIVVGKRLAEMRHLGDLGAKTRPSLARYPEAFLRHIHAVATGGMLLTYSLWAFEVSETASTTLPWFEISIAPVVLAVFRYDYLVELGRTQAPEDAILSDPVIAIGFVGWAVLALTGVYG